MPQAEPKNANAPRRGYQWATTGDINAFFGLMLDNIGVMILLGSLLSTIFQFPTEFIIAKMIPGTALGVLVGDLIYAAIAFRLARREGRHDVTAMPLGLDTPSTFGFALFILGPAFVAAKASGMDETAAASHAWHLGMTLLLCAGVIKIAGALVSEWLIKVIPRAGLLGSLAAIALVLISFLPAMEILSHPAAGLSATILLLACLSAHWRLPWRFPGVLASLIVGCVIYYGMHAMGLGPGAGAEGTHPSWTLKLQLHFPLPEWWAWLGRAESWTAIAAFLPIMIPMTLATVVGGIDCTESASTVGDRYHSSAILASDGIATLAAGLFGGVIQSTPYIGHPAYKAMGGRAAYTIATALFVGGAGIFGYFEWIFHVIPKSAIFPILIFVGLEITAGSYHATPRRHFPALAMACIPALAALALIQVNGVVGELGGKGMGLSSLSMKTQHAVQTLTMLAGGFIITSLLWATALANLIDGKVKAGAVAFGIAGVLALFGVIHSPLPTGEIAAPWTVTAKLEAAGLLEASRTQTPYYWAAGYALCAVLTLALGVFGQRSAVEGSGEETSAHP